MKINEHSQALKIPDYPMTHFIWSSVTGPGLNVLMNESRNGKGGF